MIAITVSVTAGLLSVLIMGGNMSLHARGMSPVIGFSSPSYSVDSFGDASRDPAVVRHQPEDQTDATRLAQEIKEFREDLTRSKGERAAELNEQLYLAYAALAYYFEDIISGESREQYDRAKAASNLASVRNLLIQHAGAFQKLSRHESQKMRALFHINAAQYMAGQNKARAVANLKSMSGKLGGVLKERADFIVSMHELNSGNSKEKTAAAARFARIAGTMGGEAKAAGNLIAARSMAGISASGARQHQAIDGYRRYLAAAAASARGLSDKQQEKIIGTALSIWRKAEGSRIDWAKPPFATQHFSQLADVRAVTERAAIAAYAKGQRPAAIRIYKSLAASYEGSLTRGDLDLRIADLYRAEYVTSKSPASYERTLLAMSRDYLDTGLLGQGNEARAKAVAADFSGRYKALVYQTMGKAAGRGAGSNDRLQAIAMADRYLATISDNKEIEQVKATVANLYVLNKQHDRAVALYKELAETTVTGQAKKYFVLAVRSQSVLAQWPETAPWSLNVRPGFSAEREELGQLYRKLADADKGKFQWFITAQVGLLEVNLNRAEQAFTLWHEGLAKEAAGAHAANAAGFMLTAYKKAGDWTNLEALSRLCLKSQLAALYMNRPVNVTELLALALLEGGKDAIDQSKFDVAVAKLKEFVTQHPKAARHDEGFFFLATAYRGNNQHEASIKTLQAFVDRYPSSKYYRQALLNGGDWSTMMAFEENTMFFYNRFQEKFSNDAEAPRIRRDLVAIYLGRTLFAEAIGMMNTMIRAKNQPAEDKAFAVSTLMQTEEKHGSPARAEKAADLIIGANGLSDDVKAEAYALKARLSAKKQSIATIRQIEEKLAAMSGSQIVADSLGEVRYMLAFANSGAVVKDYYNLEVRNPTALLNKRFGEYKTARAAFLKVCSAENAFCAPAMFRLARVSEEFARSLENIEIQDTLAKEVIDNFGKTKQSIMNFVSMTIQKADSQAVAVVGQGQADPEWAQAVMWQNSSDWNFDRVSGETGNGYVQWSTSAETPAE
jgi:hypothetical protein